MKEESNALSPCCSRLCLNVITAMSEEAPLHANLAAPPLAAMQRSSSDKMLAAVTDEDISDLEFVFSKPVTCLSPESDDYWIGSADGLVPDGDLSQPSPSTKNSLPDDGS